MKGRVRVLVLDGTPNSAGLIIRPEGMELPSGEVPVVFEWNQFNPFGMVGKAKYVLDGGVLYADIEMLPRVAENAALAVLYPKPEVVATEWKGQVVTKTVVRGALCLGVEKSADPKIETLAAQGIKP